MNRLRNILNDFKDYIYDSSINYKDRAFMLFSATVLIALFIAIPCGIIMHEPLSATISTFIGAVIFTVYVIISYRRDTIDRARIVISIVLIFFFLPLMFFTNGGVYGGTPIWLLLGTIYIAMILDGRRKTVMLILEGVIMIICWIVGFNYPGLITEYTRFGNYFDTMAALIIVSAIVYTLITFQNTLSRNEEEQKSLQRLFDQTATALVNAIDAKDKYTHGHSARVAEYSKKIAEQCGLSKRDCDEIYYIALLHDVGKIGIPEAIINKDGKLTDEEYATIKQHSSLGAQILESISEYPRLSIGAHYHHERYDGKGYPDHLIGTDIPEIARIISVADAYDAMTSKRSYRDPIPQQQVREEIVKGIGLQFDPKFARMMVHLIDMDIEYKMAEGNKKSVFSGDEGLLIHKYRSEVSDGILLDKCETSVHLKVGPDRKGRDPRPALVLFDALDARYHDDEGEIKDMLYFEYGEIRFDGTYDVKGARKMQTKTVRETSSEVSADDEYLIKTLRIRDHALIKLIGKEETKEIIVALPDSARFAYIGLSGGHCLISDVHIEKSEEEAPADAIPRIAEEISYIDVPAGDIPNVQIDGYRTDSTKGIPIKNGMKITFHACSLPTARLVWHCPYINIFDSDDGTVTGANYRDFTLMRLDGECWEGHPDCDVNPVVNRNDEFSGWDAWKEYNKKGFDATVSFEISENRVTVRTENQGIGIKNTSVLSNCRDTVYVALTGDQVAITDIRIHYPEAERP